MRTHRRRLGFTLIELLVTIGIIALLIGILLPVLSAVRNAGRGAVCMSNLRSITQSALIFAADHRDQLPSNRVRSSAVPDVSSGASNSHITWRSFLVLKNYMPDGPDLQDAGPDGSPVWLCPSSPTGAQSEEGFIDGFGPGATRCEDDVVSNYGYNGMLAWRYPPPQDPADLDLVRIKQPSHTVVLLETRAPWPDLRERSVIGRMGDEGFISSPTGEQAKFGGYFSWWHGGKGHWATFDGSVTALGLLETIEGQGRWRNTPPPPGTYDYWDDVVASVYR
ncbi:MAG: prepilin-type N-terminal cleavage/methylation domain-containing protein [Planctomycetota bacterium]